MKNLHFVFVLAATFAAFSTQAAVVKKASSGICHDESSAYYHHTKKFSSYPTMDACIKSGGRAARQSPKGASVIPPYDRNAFGDGWGDSDGDCRNTRHEILAETSTAPVRWSASGCTVTFGRWISPYTGDIHSNPRNLDIDHVLPLKWAWDNGAWAWTYSERVAFSNDRMNLLAVEATHNRNKGAKGIDEWLPPANECQYAARFLRVAIKYKLDPNRKLRMPSHCGGAQ